MKYKKYDMSSYNLHVIESNKFKTISIQVSFKSLLKKEEVTIRSLLPLVLLQSTKKYPTKRLLAVETEKLYSLNLSMNIRGLGNYAITSFNMSMLNEKYTEKDMYQKSLSFLCEVLFNPDVSNGSFNEKSFTVAKNVLSSNLKSLKDNTELYSIVRMLEEMAPNEPISFRSGYLEDINKITPKGLYDYYKQMIKSDMIDIYVLGDVSSEDVKSIFRKLIPINTIKKEKESIFYIHKNIRSSAKNIEEKAPVKQTKLAIGCKIFDLNDFERNYVLPMYTNILGGPSYSKLFRTVREKNSLVYRITCDYQPSNNLLITYAGLNKENANKAINLIKKEIDNMKKGNITTEELSNAQKDMISMIKGISDHPSRVINAYFLMNLLKRDSLEEMEDKFLKVTINDIKKVSKKIKLDTVFLLYGDESNEENTD